jgi:hypothetical protein
VVVNHPPKAENGPQSAPGHQERTFPGQRTELAVFGEAYVADPLVSWIVIFDHAREPLNFLAARFTVGPTILERTYRQTGDGCATGFAAS